VGKPPANTKWWQGRLKRHAGEGWLSDQVIERLRTDRPRARGSFGDWVGAQAIPNRRVAWAAILVVGALLPISWALSAWGPQVASDLPGIDTLTAERSRNLLGVLWQVHVAVAAIALPILVFTIDLTGNRPGVAATTREVLIRESFIFPILAFGLALAVRVGIDFLWFAQPSVLALDVGILSALLFLTIFAFLRALRLIFSRARLQLKALRLLGERMDEVVEATLRTRLANGLLLEWGSSLELGYHPFSDRRSGGAYANLDSNLRGRINDLHLSRLRRLLESLPRLSAPASSSDNVFGLPGPEEPKQLREVVWLRKRVGDEITDDYPELLRIETSAFEEFDRSEFAEALDGCFRVEEQSKVDEASELKSQIAYLRDSLTEGIAGGRTGQVEDIIAIYRELSETFLKKLNQLEDSYSLVLIEQQDGWLFARGWAEIDWIKDAVRQAIDDATGARNSSILLEVLFVPTHLSTIAFRYRDVRMFYEFISLVPYSYWTLAPRDPDRVRDLGIDRVWRYLSERLDLYIMPAIEDADSASEVEVLLPFAESTLSQFSRLLKTAFDECEEGDFSIFSKALRNLLRYWRDRTGGLDAAQWRLENGNLSPSEAATAREEVALLAALQQAFDALDLRKRMVQFGLAAWILFDYSDGGREGDEAARYLRHLDLPSNLVSAWRVTESAATHGKWDDPGWRSWELNAKDEGAAHFIEFNNYIYLLFLLQALCSIAKGDKSPLPDSDAFMHLAGADGQLMRQLDGIEEDPEKWRFFLNEDSVAALPELRSRLQQASEKAKQEERRSLIEASIDDNKRAEVVGRVQVGWEEEGLLRKLAEEAGVYERVQEEPPPDVLPFGLNQLDTKHAYVAETGVHTMNWGEEWGRSLARGENEMVLGALQSRLPLSEVGASDIGRATLEAIEKLRKRGLHPTVLINRSWKAESSLEKLPDFEYSNGRGDPNLLGKFHNRPVYNLHVEGLEEVIVVDLAAGIRWTQYPPPKLADDQDVIQDAISIAVELLDDERAQELIDKWQQEDRQADWTVETLKERVTLRIFERFKVDIEDEKVGVRIPVSAANA
jgi:hypothetical protein